LTVESTPALQAAGVDEDQARSALETTRFNLLFECQQGLAGVQRLEGNAAGLFGVRTNRYVAPAKK